MGGLTEHGIILSGNRFRSGKKAFGSLLAELPTPVKNLTAVEESEYGILMAWLKGEEDPLG